MLQISISYYQSTQVLTKLPKMLELQRHGWGRSYHFSLLSGVVFVWEGIKGQAGYLSALSADLHRAVSKGETVKTESRVEREASNGNLRLYKAQDPTRCLGLWNNTVSVDMLGELLIFEDLNSEDLEVVLLACLAVVLEERVRYKCWFRWEGGVPQKEAN
jgi:hypothetical protein